MRLANENTNMKTYRSEFVFKGDDDIMVNSFMLHGLLNTLDPTIPAVYGSRLIHSPRIKNPRSKYFVDKSYWPEDYYPDYVSGGGFVITNSTIFAIAKGNFLPRGFTRSWESADCRWFE